MTLKKAEDILFENVWNTFSLDPFAKAKFLETLEVYILSDQLRRMPVNISQEFVTHFETVKRFEALEACLTHLRIDSLDIHQASNRPDKRKKLARFSFNWINLLHIILLLHLLKWKQLFWVK